MRRCLAALLCLAISSRCVHTPSPPRAEGDAIDACRNGCDRSEAIGWLVVLGAIAVLGGGYLLFRYLSNDHGGPAERETLFGDEVLEEAPVPATATATVTG